jgi:AmmeMemoRadiSam system protein B/AmmeMemoRadiSam system protein A
MYGMKSLVTILILFLVSAVHAQSGQEIDMGNPDTNYIRPPAVAGSFYPGSPSELAKMLAVFFHEAPRPDISGKPVAIVAPHAGYIYSGQIAAKAYKILAGEEYKTVIVIAPSHTMYFKGVAAFDGKAYSTPLGDIPINRELTKKIVSGSDLIKISDQGHYKGPGRSEHALEVQLPFLQTTLGKFNLVALVMGDQDTFTCNSLGQAIGKAVGKSDDILIVASSDLSHFHDSKLAAQLDSMVRTDIERFDYRGLATDLATDKTEACGGGPIVAAMIVAQEMGANEVIITGHGDSGDATGDKSSVVGYLSAIIYKATKQGVYEIKDEQQETPSASEQIKAVDDERATGIRFGLSDEDKAMLLHIARQSIETSLNNKEAVFPSKLTDALCCKQGAFVTLNSHGQLRGCIGTFTSTEPLYRTISEMARQAAFHDPRFMRVSKEELNSLEIEISVLSPMKRLYNPDSVVVGRDGLYIKEGYRSGVLLPQVPVEQGWDRLEFLDNTCLKAGLPMGSWKDREAELYVFQAEIFGER